MTSALASLTMAREPPIAPGAPRPASLTHQTPRWSAGAGPSETGPSFGVFAVCSRRAAVGIRITRWPRTATEKRRHGSDRGAGTQAHNTRLVAPAFAAAPYLALAPRDLRQPLLHHRCQRATRSAHAPPPRVCASSCEGTAPRHASLYEQSSPHHHKRKESAACLQLQAACQADMLGFCDGSSCKMMESHTSGKQDHSPSVCTSQAVEAYKGFRPSVALRHSEVLLMRAANIHSLESCAWHHELRRGESRRRRPCSGARGAASARAARPAVRAG